MSPLLLLLFIVSYFTVLIGISFLTSRKGADDASFFLANRNSKWWLVAFGMIGTTLSGVTYISVPGKVGAPAGDQFSYFQFILGNAVGFIIIALVLLPLYYRLNLTSIYEFIERSLGRWSYKTAAGIFLISRTIGSSFRFYLVILVLQKFIFDYYHIPFALTAIICLTLIWSYTFRGGLKTIIITDSLQTFFLVLAVFLSIYFICKSLHYDVHTAVSAVTGSQYSKIFFWDHFVTSRFHFSKQFLGGLFITIAMVGLDQDLMQKNLSCKNIREAQKNMFTFVGVFTVINLFFLGVGALLYLYAAKNGITVARTDYLYPTIALHYLGTLPAIVFMLGLTAATFATTDSALTALTTSFCVDFLDFDKIASNKPASDKPASDKPGADRSAIPTSTSSKPGAAGSGKRRTRYIVHLLFSVLILLTVIAFNALNNEAVVSAIFKVASYTYGPLLGLYSFGLLLRTRKVRDPLVPLICLASPICCLYLNAYSKTWLGGYTFDNELIIVNGGLTFLLLLISSKRCPSTSIR
jgi:Na+/proline symporter